MCKELSKTFCENTVADVNGFPLYRCCDMVGALLLTILMWMDNRWIVPITPGFQEILCQYQLVNLSVCLSVTKTIYYKNDIYRTGDPMDFSTG